MDAANPEEHKAMLRTRYRSLQATILLYREIYEETRWPKFLRWLPANRIQVMWKEKVVQAEAQLKQHIRIMHAYRVSVRDAIK